MSADQRRASARAAARALLARGTSADELTLRMVAKEGAMPLQTLNYVYRSIAELLADLQAEFESQVALTQQDVGDGGLVIELGGLIESYVAILRDDPSNMEIIRWQMLLIGRGEIVMAGGLSMRACLSRIQERSGEQWRLPLEELSVLTQAMISGMHVQFFVRGADQVALEAWRQDAQLIVAALGRLALPEPEQPSHRGSAHDT
ncbi:MAG: hypothetical protein ACH36H_06895 [Candidatus Nanopelagicales bacterium]